VTGSLVLSLFPGIGLLDRAFEEHGFCVVRGPDLLWGGDIKRFHPPPARFEGIIGGSPCQCFSQLVYIVRHNGYRVGENLIPEFERVVAEAHPRWFVMENVVQAPIPAVDGYVVDPSVLDNRWLGEIQSRKHRFSFGTLADDCEIGRRLHYDTAALFNSTYDYRVCASDFARTRPVRKNGGGVDKRSRKGALCQRSSRSLEDALELQGLPRDFFDHSPFTKKGKGEMLGNGVPLFMGRALAKAVVDALRKPAVTA
jgi:DNA (cytosine-5)-methyltransferase 1